MEANDYFIMAIVCAILFVGTLVESVQWNATVTASPHMYDQIAYGIVGGVFFISPFLIIAFNVAGFVKIAIKRRSK